MIDDLVDFLIYFDLRESLLGSFTDFQVNILYSLLIILFFNIILILFFWNCYGDTIYSNFIKSSTLIEIEALRKSVEKLKLPKEHTPRL
ncbi:hypothetical protein PVAND_005791 [Polypedilum vanderplanki]|uniref:Uncharacterized protein n=1 Tax=Polypedilum vanderplanki TaxID=319348 RepID=A0A9J6C341_POLVA|nr:hypothetical protein PVAND_005791 [Polypedilum vanderplanki]